LKMVFIALIKMTSSFCQAEKLIFTALSATEYTLISLLLRARYAMLSCTWQARIDKLRRDLLSFSRSI